VAVAGTLTLIVPGCCGPLPAQYAALKFLAPELHQLPLWKCLSRADKINVADSFHQQLAKLFDFDDASCPLPSAALDLLGEEGSPEEAFWLHADPACMQADIDHAILFDAQSLQLADHEADQLISELNSHFSQDDIFLRRGSAANWYLSINSHQSFATSALHDVVGRNVNQFMPSGIDASFWKRFMNEAQMLLHMSEVNEQREARGHLPVNSLWLWGEGRLPVAATTEPRFDRILANNVSARGLAKLHGVPCEAVPSDMAALTALLAQSEHVCLVLDDLFGSISYADIALWQEKLIALDESWLQPLIQHAIRNTISLQLYPCNGSAYRLSANNRFRFWKRGEVKDHLRLDA
jgi:hypothetical protein